MPVTVQLFHVHFDHEPEVYCHVCPEHRAFADTLACPDEHWPPGSCDHVQYSDCHCDEAGCIACRNEVF